MEKLIKVRGQYPNWFLYMEIRYSSYIYIFDLRLLEKLIEPSVVHSLMNAMDHAKCRDVKTTDAFGDLIGRCYCCDDVAALKLSKYNPPAPNAACNVKFSPRYARKIM